jgi:hypothetical protein
VAIAMNEETARTDAELAPAQPNPETTKPAELPLPSLENCKTAISAGGKTGLAAIDALPAALQTECPGLAAILRSSAIKTILETYDRQDAEAVRQQTELMREANLANICLLGAGVTSAVILAVAAATKDSVGPNYITLVLGLLTLALGAGAAYFGFIARDQGRIARWQASRGDAEMARLAVFKTMAAKVGETSPKIALFGLAVVLRDLLDDQRNYLGKAALRHRKSSEMTSRWGGLASALAFIGGSGAIIASQGGASWTVWIVLAGVVGAAIGAYSANRDALLRDRANADRYEKTRVALDGIAARTDDIAGKIAAGEPRALGALTDTIAELLATEHKQWQEGTAQAEASLAKLDGQLEQLGKDKQSGNT